MSKKKNEEMWKRFRYIHKSMTEKEITKQFIYFMLPDKIADKHGNTYKELFMKENVGFKPFRHSKLQKKMVRTGRLA